MAGSLCCPVPLLSRTNRVYYFGVPIVLREPSSAGAAPVGHALRGSTPCKPDVGQARHLGSDLCLLSPIHGGSPLPCSVLCAGGTALSRRASVPKGGGEESTLITPQMRSHRNLQGAHSSEHKTHPPPPPRNCPISDNKGGGQVSVPHLPSFLARGSDLSCPWRSEVAGDLCCHLQVRGG